MRNGLTDIVSEFRLMTSESGTAIFTDDQIQSILDRNKVSLFASPLLYSLTRESGTAVYKNYYHPYGGYLEGTASGTAIVRVHDSNGSVVTGYTQSESDGRFDFTANTSGTAYYYTGNQFDLNAAVSEGWKVKAASLADNFDFSAEGRSYKKSQVIQHCLAMSKHFASESKPSYGEIYKSDCL